MPRTECQECHARQIVWAAVLLLATILFSPLVLIVIYLIIITYDQLESTIKKHFEQYIEMPSC